MKTLKRYLKVVKLTEIVNKAIAQKITQQH